MLVIKLRDFFVIAIEHICDAIMCFTLIEKRCRSLCLSMKAIAIDEVAWVSAKECDLTITPDRL